MKWIERGKKPAPNLSVYAHKCVVAAAAAAGIIFSMCTDSFNNYITLHFTYTKYCSNLKLMRLTLHGACQPTIAVVFVVILNSYSMDLCSFVVCSGFGLDNLKKNSKPHTKTYTHTHCVQPKPSGSG